MLRSQARGHVGATLFSPLFQALGLGHLDPTQGKKDIDESETVELPLWLAEPLQEGRIGIIDLPRAFSASVRDQLLAAPTTVRLRDKSPYFYETGLRLASQCSSEDAQRLPSAVKATLAGVSRTAAFVAS